MEIARDGSISTPIFLGSIELGPPAVRIPLLITLLRSELHWADIHLLQVPGGVNAGLDLALLVEIQDGVQGLVDQFRLAFQIA